MADEPGGASPVAVGAFLVARWLFACGAWLGGRALFGMPLDVPAVVSAAVFATVYPFVATWAQGLRRRRGDVPARWRTWDGDRPGRWSSGWLRRGGGLAEGRGTFGRPGVRVAAVDVVSIAERPATVGESWLLDVRARMLEVTLRYGRADLLVLPRDVADVRRVLTA